MPLTLEDGTGLAEANAYADRTYADAYFLLRGNTAWGALSTALRDEALIRATDYIDVRWGPLLRSTRLTETQALEFPMVAFYNRHGFLVEGLPDKVRKATCEYAFRAATVDLMPDPEIDASGSRLTLKRERGGPIEEETAFSTYGQAIITIRPYPLADRLLADFVGRAGTNYR